MTTSDLDRSADDALRQYGIPSILWLIYGSIATFALVVIGCFQRYKYVNPDTPAAQLTRAVDALGSGQDLDAHRLFEKLAANGNPAAEYWLADMYQYGLGTAKNLPAAVALFQTSAVKGFVPAQLRLGELYLAGTEIDPDYAKARDLLGRLLPRATPQRSASSGRCMKRDLASRDPFLAAVDYSAAAAHGDRLAAPERDSIMPQLSPDQIAQIQPERAKLGLTKYQAELTAGLCN